jgi:hypothetical protein
MWKEDFHWPWKGILNNPGFIKGRKQVQDESFAFVGEIYIYCN